MNKFLFKNLEAGCAFGINQKPLTFHVITFIKREEDNLYFFDSTTSELIHFNKDNFVRGLNTPCDSPYSVKTPCIEFIEKIPDEVLKVIKATTEKNWNSKETKLIYNLIQKG